MKIVLRLPLCWALTYQPHPNCKWDPKSTANGQNPNYPKNVFHFEITHFNILKNENCLKQETDQGVAQLWSCIAHSKTNQPMQITLKALWDVAQISCQSDQSCPTDGLKYQ